MCGLAGYLNLTRKNFTLDESLLHLMAERLAHRGPNGYRVWQSPEHELALMHRRLSIVDLSDGAFQPMIDADRSVLVCCNGEIYNHPQLRRELEGRGYKYFSNSDTETLLYAYKEWGIDFLQRLEGMFVIILFDFKRNELYLVRDHIGIKPLYFSLQGGVLSFASEIKALWDLPWNVKSVKPAALHHYLTYLATPAPMTLYDGIYKLPPAFYMKVDANRAITFNEWWSPIVENSEYSPEQLNNEEWCVDQIRTHLRSSINKMMMSDVPFGVFLSGGIDSSLNVALMSESTDKVKTFNVSFSDGPEYSEVAWARKVAKQYNTEHYELVISEKEAFEFFQKMVYHQDEPLGDCVCVPLYYVSKLLKDSGVTVVQVGEGSDELFCGYNFYARNLKLERPWTLSQKFMPSFARWGLYKVLKTVAPHKFNSLELIKNWASDRALFWGGNVVFSEEWKHQFALYAKNDPFDPIIDQIYPGFSQACDSYAVVEYHLRELYKKDFNADFLKSMIYLELKHRLSELLLMRVDKMTMATSVEARVPFLDHKMVEFAMQIPQSLKYKNGVTKYILKKACEGILPHDVIYRKKVGFAAPTTRWFTKGTYFRPFFNDMLATGNAWSSMFDVSKIQGMLKTTESGAADYSYQLWALQNLMAADVK